MAPRHPPPGTSRGSPTGREGSAAPIISPISRHSNLNLLVFFLNFGRTGDRAGSRSSLLSRVLGRCYGCWGRKWGPRSVGPVTLGRDGALVGGDYAVGNGKCDGRVANVTWSDVDEGVEFVWRVFGARAGDGPVGVGLGGWVLGPVPGTWVGLACK